MTFRYLDSLPSNIFKLKYFPHSFPLDAKLGTKTFYIWRSIYQALHLLKEGLLWKIGNGEKVQIWRDKWLPKNSYGNVQCPISILPTSAMVSDLINTQTSWWDFELIQTIFTESSTKQILNLHVSIYPKDDKVIW